MSLARLAVVLPVTLHARPAALVARVAVDAAADVRLDGADARSVTALMCLDARAGQQVELTADGPGAERAVAAVAAVVERLGDPRTEDGR